jgi:hypothetical protein
METFRHDLTGDERGADHDGGGVGPGCAERAGRGSAGVYDITFTRTQGTETPTGFFTYDATVGPAGTFSDFLVTHRGVICDFTAAANASFPVVGCGTGASGLAIMAGTTACLTDQVWRFFDGSA